MWDLLMIPLSGASALPPPSPFYTPTHIPSLCREKEEKSSAARLNVNRHMK
jgi:hypothetical protein